MSGTKFSRFLQYFSGYDYPHVSISLTEDLSEMYSFGRQRLNMPWIAGFVVEKQNAGVYAKYNSKCEILSFEVSEDSYKRLEKVITKVKENKCVYKYNFTGLVFSYFSIERELKTKFTCTQFVAWLLSDANLDFWDKDASIVFPDDYYIIPDVTTIYKGYINNYRNKNSA